MAQSTVCHTGVGDEAVCLIDVFTGLMWPRNGDIAGGTRTWQGAFPEMLTSLLSFLLPPEQGQES